MSAPVHPDDIVCLATAANPVQAHIWEQVLQAEGIRANVVGDYLDASVGNIPGTKPELWVHRDDVARAEEILREPEDHPASAELDEEELNEEELDEEEPDEA